MAKGAIKPITLEGGLTFKTGKGLKKIVPRKDRKSLNIEYLEKNTPLSKMLKEKIEKNVSDFYRKKNKTKDDYFFKVRETTSNKFNDLKSKQDLLSLNESLTEIKNGFSGILLKVNAFKENTLQRRFFKSFLKKKKETITSIVDSLNQINSLNHKLVEYSNNPEYKNTFVRLTKERNSLVESTIDKYTELKIDLEIITSSGFLNGISM